MNKQTAAYIQAEISQRKTDGKSPIVAKAEVEALCTALISMGQLTTVDIDNIINKVYTTTPIPNLKLDWPVVKTDEKTGKMTALDNHPDNFEYYLRHTERQIRRVLNKKVVVREDRIYSYDDIEACRIITELDRVNESKITADKLSTYIKNLAFAEGNQDLLAEWAYSKPWDGIDRIRQLYETLDSKNPSEEQFIFFKYAINGMAVQALDLKYNGTELAGKNEILLILQSRTQGNGKTTWCNTLIPKLGEIPLLHEGELDFSKDGIINGSTMILWVVSEIEACLNNAVFGKIKDHLSKNSSSVREAYGREAQHYRRSVTFIGSTNAQYFLPADEKQRRFLVIEVGKINFNHGIDIQQVWAQIIEERKAGCKNWFEPEEIIMLNQMNKPFTKRGSVLMWFEAGWTVFDAADKDLSTIGTNIDDLYKDYSKYCNDNNLSDKKQLPSFSEAIENIDDIDYKSYIKKNKRYYNLRRKTSAEKQQEMPE